jgi:plastocyanin
MKRNKLLLTAAGAVIIITMAIFVGNPLAIETEKQCALATIKSHEGISPETLHIKKGDCVAWINRTRAEDVKITFKEGTRCQDMMKSAVGFKKDWKDCCVTDYLSPGRASSLLFDQAGTFNYEVEFRPSSRSGSGFSIGTQRFGTIIVE